jgi:excisionase family DNA binding protein
VINVEYKLPPGGAVGAEKNNRPDLGTPTSGLFYCPKNGGFIMESNLKFYTLAETARELRISRVTLYRRVKDGSVPFKKLGGRVLIPAKFVIDFSNFDSAVGKAEECHAE